MAAAGKLTKEEFSASQLNTTKAPQAISMDANPKPHHAEGEVRSMVFPAIKKAGTRENSSKRS
ncbi:MAG: hypothetical protein NPIRA03_28930 [Nitrospirales bacterium]|nr:MAG: hypothetical protein NPIRA03_28930 [Nitrospirales bacterium]